MIITIKEDDNTIIKFKGITRIGFSDFHIHFSDENDNSHCIPFRKVLTINNE